VCPIPARTETNSSGILAGSQGATVGNVAGHEVCAAAGEARVHHPVLEGIRRTGIDVGLALQLQLSAQNLLVERHGLTAIAVERHIGILSSSLPLSVG
jgi:hypothetical protein